MADAPERIDIWAQSMCRELRQQAYLVPYTVMMKAIQDVGTAPDLPAAVTVDQIEAITMHFLGHPTGDPSPHLEWPISRQWTSKEVVKRMQNAFASVGLTPAAVTVKPLEWYESGTRSIGRAPDGHFWVLDCRDGQWGLIERGRGGFIVGQGNAYFFTGPDDAKLGADILNRKRILPNLSALTPAPVPVKPLNWREQSDREYWYSADGFGVKYEVKEIGLSEWWLSIDGEMQTVPFDYCRDAKAAAQTDYERRIPPQINVSPAPGEQPVTEGSDVQEADTSLCIECGSTLSSPSEAVCYTCVSTARAALRALEGGE